jgi:hypothetical protein
MRRGEILAVGAAILAILFYALGQGSEDLVLFANYGLIVYMGIAALIGIITYLKLGSSRMADFTLGYALGLLSWMIGLGIYTYTYMIAGTELPYLSIADVFYLLSYPAWIITAVRMLQIFGRAVAKNARMLVAGVGVILYVLIAVFVIPLSVSGLESPLEVIVTVLYPSLDVAFFLLVFALYFAFRKGMFERPFAFMALGTVLLALGDLAYTVLNVASLYSEGNLLDLLLFLGCIGAGYGFWCQYAGLSKLK